jgi:hypothetical protein
MEVRLEQVRTGEVAGGLAIDVQLYGMKGMIAV